MKTVYTLHCNECGTMLSDQGYCEYCKFFPSAQDTVFQQSTMILDNQDEEDHE